MSDFMLPRYCACAVMGSKVYSIGGETLQGTLTNQITVYDTLSSNRCWEEQVPYMYGWRTSPTAVTLGGKFYVFGGRENPPFCEFYDSTTNKWTSIPDPPSNDIPLGITGAAVYAQSTIIIWNPDVFYLLDVSGSLPKWHCIEAPQIGEDSNDYVGNNTVVVNGIVYWSARDLFAFDLARNKGFDKPAFKFDDSHSTVAPSIDFLSARALASPPILAATGEDQLSVIWFHKEHKADQSLKVYCKKFLIQTSDDSEKQLLLHNNHDPTENLEFDIQGINLYQYGAVQWHHDDKDEHNLYRDDTKHAILNHVDLLQNLSCSMFKENFNSFSRIQQNNVVVEFKDGYLELVDLAQQEELFEKDDMPIEEFLNGLGLQKYAKICIENNFLQIDMKGLKLMSDEMLKKLKIPMGPRAVILSSINPTS